MLKTSILAAMTFVFSVLLSGALVYSEGAEDIFANNTFQASSDVQAESTTIFTKVFAASSLIN